MARVNKRNVAMPFIMGQTEDLKDPEHEYYFKEDEKSEEIRAKYVEHIGKMFDLAALMP